MAEVILQSFDSTISVMSAGTHPAEQVHPLAKRYCKNWVYRSKIYTPKWLIPFCLKVGISLLPFVVGLMKLVLLFWEKLTDPIHIGFDEPAEAIGDEANVLPVFRRVRNEILLEFFKLYHTQIKRA